MKPLLTTDSLLYLRRLAKELNSLPDGFYYDGHRYTKASASVADPNIYFPTSEAIGVLHLTRLISATPKTGSYASVGLAGVNAQKICDAYGHQVCASRKPPK